MIYTFDFYFACEDRGTDQVLARLNIYMSLKFIMPIKKFQMITKCNGDEIFL